MPADGSDSKPAAPIDDDPPLAVLSYADPGERRFATHPAVAVTGWACFVLLVVLVSSYGDLISDPVSEWMMYVLAIASLTALVAGIITRRVLPRGATNRGLGLVRMLLGALFGVLSLFNIYCMLTGVSRYLR